MKSANRHFSETLFLLLVFALSFTFHPVKAQVKITDGSTVTIDNNSLLELESNNRGLLIPRVPVNSFTQPAPLTAPVPAGMLVYSLSGLIPDGFYFWNGAKWVSIGNSVVPVSKSASCTLIKSETLVMASGDITLTLPVITVADNGLTITIKNTGTALNLVNIAGNSGAMIDGISNSNLTRWEGRSYLAWNGNWITLNKENKTENLFEVSPGSSFTTIAEIVGFLNLHMSGPSVVRISGGDHMITSTQSINLPYPVTFEGISFGETKIKAAAGVSGNVLFNCSSECYFKMLTFEAISNSAGNDAIHFTGSGIYHEVKDALFTGFNKAIVSNTNNDLWIFEVDITDCSAAGLEIDAGASTGGQMRISETDFMNCGTGIILKSGLEETISVQNCTFYNKLSGSQVGIKYFPDGFTPFKSMKITNNGWNNEGTFISGFDFSRSDGRDADAMLIANAGIEDEKPHCKINVVDNILTTNIINGGTFYKANWVNSTVYQSKWNVSGNKITYQSTNKSDGWMVITGNLSNSSSNHVITLGVVKNRVTSARYGETSLRVINANQPFQFSTVVYVPDFTKNDYLELFVTSSSNSDVITFSDVHWFINAE